VSASPWVRRFAPLVVHGGAVLDVAAGDGRHSRLFLARGHPVTAVDIDAGGLPEHDRLTVVAADIERAPWPFADQLFAGVVVTNYLWRPLLPGIAAAVAPGGVLIYETFMRGNEHIGKPRNPDFLLEPGELYEFFSPRLNIVAFEQGVVQRPHPRVVQRLCAVRDPATPLLA